jgi:putative transposase
MRELPLDAGLGRLCGLFGMTRQAWYEQRWHVDDRRMAEAEVLDLVDKKRGDGRYGARMLLELLGPDFAERGIRIGRDRFIELLRMHGRLLRPRRRYVQTTDSNHGLRKADYLLKDLEVTAAEQAWVCDITYIRTVNGFLYLSLVTDAFSRKVMGYHLSHRLEARGAVAALRMAISQRSFPERELLHHSDRGVQYCSENYTAVLKAAGIATSMTEGGSPQQNTIAERINRTFKEQLYMGECFASYKDAMARLQRAVQIYNTVRPHSSCAGMTPQQAHMQEGPLKRSWKNYKKKTAKGGGADALHTSSQV